AVCPAAVAGSGTRAIGTAKITVDHDAPGERSFARLDTARGTRTARPESSSGTEMALAGHVVDLDANAGRSLEEDRVIAGCELRSLCRRVNYARSELVDRKAMDRVDVRAAARAQAQMMQPGAVLIETLPAFLARRAAYEDAGAAADTVDDVVA